MTATITTITDTTFEQVVTAIATLEAIFQAKNGEAKSLRAGANASKIEAYSRLIVTIIAFKIRKGSKRAGDLRAALEAAGISTACAKRYMEIGQAAAKLPMLKGIDTDDEILAVLYENQITTESALKAMCFPIVEPTTVEKLITLAVAGTVTSDEALQALLDAAAAVNPAARDVANTLVSAINQKIAA